MESSDLQLEFLQKKSARAKQVTNREVLVAVYHWITWFVLLGLLLANLLTLTGFSVSSDTHAEFGTNPSLTTTKAAQIQGENDQPFSDRTVVCVTAGRYYKPMLLNQALSANVTTTLLNKTNTNGNTSSRHGYKVITRTRATALSSTAYDAYLYQCAQLAEALTGVLDICDSLGYNVSRDKLRVVTETSDGTRSLHELANSLPVLIKPFYDNSVMGSAFAPSSDGSACMFVLDGRMIDPLDSSAKMQAVDRSVRESKTKEWLRSTNGTWRHGWYDDETSGQSYYSEMLAINRVSDDAQRPLGIQGRTFDPINNKELNCAAAPSACTGLPKVQSFGQSFNTTNALTWLDQVVISNANHKGYFHLKSAGIQTVTSGYDLQTFLANMSLAAVLLRWMVCMLALYNGYRLGVTNWHSAGIGCMSCAYSFNMMPVMTAPRLNILLAAFWTCGGQFDGEQAGLSESWFVMYPSLATFVLVYFAVLNIAAKVFFRRFTDNGFAPTVLVLCLLHFFRHTIADSGLFGFDGRVTSLIESKDFDKLSAIDLITTHAALRMNGNIVSLFMLKIVVLAANLVPLLFSDNMTSKGKKYTTFVPCDIERALAIRASNVGGLGKSRVYEGEESSVPELMEAHGVDAPVEADVRPWTDTYTKWKTPVVKGQNAIEDTVDVELNSYEVLRLGYVIFGGQFLISFDDWYIVSTFVPLRFIDKLWNHRVTVFQVSLRQDGFHLSPTAQLCRIDDPRLMCIPFYDVSVCSFK